MTLWVNFCCMVIFFPVYWSYEFRWTSNSAIISAVFDELGVTRVAVGFAMWGLTYVALIASIVRSYLQHRIDRSKISTFLLWYHVVYIIARWPIFSVLIAASCNSPTVNAPLGLTEAPMCAFVHYPVAFIAFLFDYITAVPLAGLVMIAEDLYPKCVNKYNW